MGRALSHGGCDTGVIVCMSDRSRGKCGTETGPCCIMPGSTDAGNVADPHEAPVADLEGAEGIDISTSNDEAGNRLLH